MSTTHLSGPVVQINGRIIQRCAVCGEKLRDSTGAEVQLNEDGTTPVYGVWPEQVFIRHNESMWIQVPVNDNKVLPKDFCIDLVEQEMR